MKLISYTIVDFYLLLYKNGLLICKYAPQCKVSDHTQVTVKACGPLVFTFYFILFFTFSFRSSVYLQFIPKPIFWHSTLYCLSLSFSDRVSLCDFFSRTYELFLQNVDFWCNRVLTRNILNICCFLLFSYLCIHVSIHIKSFPFDIVNF